MNQISEELIEVVKVFGVGFTEPIIALTDGITNIILVTTGCIIVCKCLFLVLKKLECCNNQINQIN